MDWALYDKLPWELGTARKRDSSEPQSTRLANKEHPSKCTFHMVETKENIFTGHKAKLSQDTEQDRRKNLIWFFSYVHNDSFSHALGLLEAE